MQSAPETIQLHRKSGILELRWPDQGHFELSAEFLRVYSPSAEVRGHGPGQEVLQTGKSQVRIVAIRAVGNYAIRLDFDDGHNSGIYSWDYLLELGQNRESLWQDYLDKLKAAGARRDPLPADTEVITIRPSSENSTPRKT